MLPGQTLDRKTSQTSKTPCLGEKFQQTLASKVEKEAVLAKVVVASKCSKENRGKEISSSHRREGYGHSQFFVGALLPGTGVDSATIQH